MTTQVNAAAPIVNATAPILDAGRKRRKTNVLPGWPITWLLVGFPLWWALGLGAFIFHVAAVLMVVLLWRHREVRLPPGFGWWILFLLAVVGSMLMLGLNPPGTVAQGVGGRAVVALFRLSQYLAISVLILYVYNLTKDQLSIRRLGWQMGLLFVYSIGFGLIALVAPGLEWPAPIELVLPSAISSNQWVVSMVHPSIAQVQDFLGYEHARVAAPFGYTNTWGASVAMLLPWFVACWVVIARGWQRAIGIGILAVSVIPIISSVNRGLWMAIAACAVLAAIMLIVNGRLEVLLPASAGLAVAALIVAMSPLGSLAVERLDTPHSNGVREFTTEKAIELSAHSPLIGFGSTRQALGSAQSVAVGKTPECPTCGNTPLGQNGLLWMILIGQGIIGVVLFFGMFLRATFESLRTSGLMAAAAASSMVAGLVLTTYYDLIIAPLALWGITVAMVWRIADGEQ